MHTKNKGKPKKNNKTQAYSTPSLGLGPGPRPGPAWASALGVLRVLLFFLGFPLFLVCICHYWVGN